MDTTILQVPVKKTIRDEALNAALASGFSSLQEAVRVFLVNLSRSVVRVSFEPKSVQLSVKAARRYDKMSEEVRSRKVKPFVTHSVDELMRYLTRP